MKMTNTVTMPATKTRLNTEPRIFWTTSRGEKGAWRISTGTGFCSAGWLLAGGGGCGISSSVRSRMVRVARVIRPLPEVRIEVTFLRIFCWYSGNLWAKSVICEPIKLPITETMKMENRTTINAAGVRPNLHRLNQITGGAKRKVSRTARARGTNTARAK